MTFVNGLCDVSNQSDYVRNIGKMYPQLFNGLGCMRGNYSIKLQPDAQPYAVQVPRRIAIPHLKKVRTELDRLQALDVIRQVD